LPTDGRLGEEHVQVCLLAGLRRADRADDLGRPAVHAGRALRRRGRENQPADDGRPHQRDLLGDEAANGEAEQDVHRSSEREVVTSIEKMLRWARHRIVRNLLAAMNS
jgi:hypothetical protein